MKCKSIIMLLLGLGLCVHSFGQEAEVKAPRAPIPVEVFAGNNYLNFQLIIAKPFREGGKLGFFNVTNFNGTYDNTLNRNEFLSQVLVNYELIKGVSVAGGATMNYMTGFRPTAGLQYLFANPNWLFVLLPRVDLRDDFNIETFTLLEYKPRINDKLGFYSRIQGLYNHNTNLDFHDRSYLYLRAGLSLHQYQFGLGANLDQYGPMKAFGDNYGVFVRVELR